MLNTVHRIIAPQWLGAKRIVVFEDSETIGQLFPMNVLRPSWEIRAGLGCLREWLSILRTAGYSVALRPRDNLVVRAGEMAGFDDSWTELNEPVIFINGRVLHLPATDDPGRSCLVDDNGLVLWARVDGPSVSKLLSLPGTSLAEAIVKQVDGVTRISEFGGISASFVWDYMAANHGLLKSGLAGGEDEILGAVEMPDQVEGVYKIGEHPVYCGAGSTIYPTVVLDSKSGPIWIGEDVTIEPHSFLKGPLMLGNHCKVKAGSVLYEGSSIGPHCRISGEISNSIMQGYSNKQHAGFLGNSHLGEWVNLGADTTISNLRNDYGPIKVKLNQRLVDSGRQFVGLLCGDHTKTGINTMFNTGTVVGIGANVYGGGYPPRFIRSFSWGGNDGFHVEPFERTLESARIAASRRSRELTNAEVELLKEHYAYIVKQEN